MLQSRARAWTSVILAGKRDSRRESTMGFWRECDSEENKSSAVRRFMILCSGKGLISFNKDNRVTSLVKKKYNKAFGGVDFLRIRQKSWKLNLVLAAVLVLETEGL